MINDKARRKSNALVNIIYLDDIGFWSKTYRYLVIKQKEQSKLKIQKTRLSHENKETQMTGQHVPLWKPEVKSGAPEG